MIHQTRETETIGRTPELPRKRVVLVAMGDPGDAQNVTQALQARGTEVVAVGNGYLAVQEILSRTFDAAVIGPSIEGLSGAEVVRSLRRAQESTPVLLLEAGGAFTARRQWLEARVFRMTMPRHAVVAAMTVEMRVEAEASEVSPGHLPLKDFRARRILPFPDEPAESDPNWQ